MTIFAILLVATLLFHGSLNMMLENIEDYETIPLPPKKLTKITTLNPVIKVDATSKETWTLVDFSTGETHRIGDLEKQRSLLGRLSWDLGFQRTKIITNSGITNPKGRAGVINLGPIAFDDLRQPPTSGFVQDSLSFGKRINKAITGWYNYRTRTHNVESRKNVYVVKTAAGPYLKMRILNYYCRLQESDCKTIMCAREDAACLTIEYVFAHEISNQFPASPVPPLAGLPAQNIN